MVAECGGRVRARSTLSLRPKEWIMAKIYETVDDIGLKACISKVKELAELLHQCNRLTDDAIEGIGNLLESPLGTVEAGKIQLDYQYSVATIIKGTLEKHHEAMRDMGVDLAKAYGKWQDQHDLREKAQDGIPNLRPHDQPSDATGVRDRQGKGLS